MADELTSPEEEVVEEQQEDQEVSDSEVIEEKTDEKPDPIAELSKNLLDEVTALRGERRELRGELESLKTGIQELRSSQPQADLEESPIQKFKRENPEALLTADVYAAQEEWRDQQATRAAEEAETKAAMEAKKKEEQILVESASKSERQALVDYSTEKAGQGLDLRSVLTAGERYLTPGDKLDISQGGEKAFQIAYTRCLQRIRESDTNDAKLFEQRIENHRNSIKTKVNQQEVEEEQIIPESDSQFKNIIDYVFKET